MTAPAPINVPSPDGSDHLHRQNMPFYLLFSAVIAGGFLTVLFSVLSYLGFIELVSIENQFVTISALHEEIVHRDDILVLSSRMAAVTGERAWIEKYETNAKKLQSAIESLQNLMVDKSLMGDLVAAHREIRAEESKSLELVLKGKLKSALDVLNDSKADSQRELYLKSIERIRERIKERAKNEESYRQRKIASAIAGSIGFAFIVLIVWGLSYRQLKAWNLELTSSRIGLHAVLEQAPVRLWAVDRNLRITTSLGGTETRKIEDDPKLGVGLTLDEFLQGDASRRDHIIRHQNVLEGKTETFEAIRNGRIFLARLDPFRNADGEIAGCLGVALDITEMRNIDLELTGTRHLLEWISTGKSLNEIMNESLKVVEPLDKSMMGSILLLDDTGKFLSVAAAPSLPGGYNAAIEGVEIGQDVGSCGTSAFTGKLVITEDIETDPKWAKFKDIAIGYGLRACWSQPIISSHGKVLGTLAVYYPVPKKPNGVQLRLLEGTAHILAIAIEKHHHDRKLQLAMERVTQSNEDLEKFAYVASHDLREPLRTISNYIGMLSEKIKVHLDSKSAEFMGYIEDAAVRLQERVDALLDYSRIGGYQENFSPVNSELVVAKTLGDLKAALEDRHAKIRVGRLPNIMGDADQLGHLFQNLICNALKFAKPGQQPNIEISCKKSENEWEFLVKDDGIGVEEKYLKKIFEIYQRLNPQSEYPGVGIGLAICKKIVKGHGGTIWMESQLGKGATVHFTLPFHNFPVEVDKKDLRILVVDDSPSDRNMTADILEKSGVRTELAADFKQAMEKLAHSEFDVILMDLEMPGMDGVETALEMRKRGVKTPIVAYSGVAFGSPKQVDSSRLFSGFISKSAKNERIIDRLNAFRVPLDKTS